MLIENLYLNMMRWICSAEKEKQDEEEKRELQDVEKENNVPVNKYIYVLIYCIRSKITKY